MTDSTLPGASVPADATILVRIAARMPADARVHVLAALSALPAASRVTADLAADEAHFWVTTRAAPELLAQLAAVAAEVGITVRWDPAAGAELVLPPETGAASAITTAPSAAPAPAGETAERRPAVVTVVERPAPEPERRALPAPGAAEEPRIGHRRGPYIPPNTVAVIIPSHNEEAVIAATLKTVMRAYRPEDIYVFCDGCTDATVTIARRYLPYDNVIDHKQNIGKSRGLEYTLNNYIFPRGYKYVTITDADTTMEADFLVNTLKVLRRKDVACAVGQVRSRWYSNNLIAVYRTYMYFLWQMVYKRMQSLTNSISIACGCSTTWKTRVLQQLEFDHRMSTEDFSLTIQVHRKRLGKIKYVPGSVVWTQEPFGIASYRKQTYRWTRAWWESVRKYRVGLHWLRLKNGLPVGLSVLDVSTFLLTFDFWMFFASVLLLPLLLIRPVDLHLWWFSLNSRPAILFALAWQYGTIVMSALIVSILTRKPRIFFYSPAFIFLMYLDIIVGVQAITSTIRSLYRRAPRRHEAREASIWVSPERRKVA
ncbi:MAG: glycosyltransferase family 2 protein [Dehalococcoidia bacterium]